MTGRRPDRTRVWNFLDNFRCREGTGEAGQGEVCSVDGVGKNWTTLPGNFKRHGYLTIGNGKTFHPGDPWQVSHILTRIRTCILISPLGDPWQFDYPHSWSSELPYAFGGGALEGHPSRRDTTSDRLLCDNTTVICAEGIVDCPAEARIDGDNSTWCSLNSTKLKALLPGVSP